MTQLVRLFVELLISRYGGNKNLLWYHKSEVELVERLDFLNNYARGLLHVRNSILAVTDGAPENPDMALVLDSDTHKLIVGGHLGILDAIESGQVELSGDVDRQVA